MDWWPAWAALAVMAGWITATADMHALPTDFEPRVNVTRKAGEKVGIFRWGLVGAIIGGNLPLRVNDRERAAKLGVVRGLKPGRLGRARKAKLDLAESGGPIWRQGTRERIGARTVACVGA